MKTNSTMRINRILHSFLLSCMMLISISTFAAKKDLDRNYWRHLKDGIRYDESPNGDRFNRNWADDFDPDKIRAKKRDGKGGYGKYSRKNRNAQDGGNSNFGQDKGGKEIEQRELEKDLPTNEPYITISSGGSGLGALGWILIGIGAVLLGYLIYKIIDNNSRRRDKKIENITYEEEVEEHVDAVELPKSELELKLAAALKDNNFREAIRIYFIFIIKELREKNWINWERKKTNTLYLYEMRERSQYSIFSQSVMIFELIWYGKQEISKEDYSKLEPLFKKMLNEIEKGQA